MPIGIPKVPFRSPGEEDASWVDVNRLYRQRLLFLGQEVDVEITNQLIGLIVFLSIEDGRKDLYLFINSPGGSVMPGVALYDLMQHVQPDIQTICMGLAASMGSFILVGGEITKRLAFPHARRVMIHQPSSSFHEAPTGEFILEAGELLKVREKITKIYARRTGQPLSVLSEDMERDTYMSATEAQAHGIVDLLAVEL
uniref:ATP-dependent Clp protease proteolytic subunit n=2 Tax=Casuarina TaxID=3521 RepID=A0A8E8PE61_CASEQ|nr:ATP-dependent Clp protease proteolytic subunit [Casuarina glauca]YP_010200025.1 ATP-dependent Clp protease proteolytic subunit [Casuarina cunninghamiana]QWE50936.1 ATP-dependent Clp protease proteolytic subunit [Casuarina equisetifolia]QDA81669.1 ATP-dependent Clp protease proteolytic subunit [Casuarina glauca]QXF29367.1 ATP-dependent Clp protease proteolytic subunit [Casuarina equisetifolia]UAD90196.1 ATP-dependent Clp protease proteolytic subunit [Casuarina cunninghamiana]